MSPSDRVRAISYSTSTETIHLSLYRFRDIVSYLLKFTDFNLPSPAFGALAKATHSTWGRLFHAIAAGVGKSVNFNK